MEFCIDRNVELRSSFFSVSSSERTILWPSNDTTTASASIRAIKFDDDETVRQGIQAQKELAPQVLHLRINPLAGKVETTGRQSFPRHQSSATWEFIREGAGDGSPSSIGYPRHSQPMHRSGDALSVLLGAQDGLQPEV
ncbi:hypothetical protein AMATHDRAFT_49389 [Amanita thiersii Skay4041]|uniref:Uncharacterized protein n=1 Tax=Amanita thiersii Skay4041 TaxID=703135 RepID=A0A2A9NLJ0_9AGAR|nr:hypothetical protein AMATHDRAFT_49389 [Amanita thiersii Skay4041]